MSPTDSGPFWAQRCLHKQTSPPDEMGDAICADCGGRVRTVLTKAALFDAFDSVERDFGSFGRHDKGCVHTADGQWLCTTTCPIGSRS